jgi:ferrochelatase
MTDYDAILLHSFGGPEGPDDVIPFLENVTRGRGIPRERLAVVGEHYGLFGGVSPINDQNRALIAALRAELDAHGIELPIHWGNRNWHPLLDDAVREMVEAGHRRVLALVTSAFGSYSGCRQYRDDLDRAVAATGGTITIDKAPLYWNHPGFLDAVTDRVLTGFAALGSAAADARLVFTAHSIPSSWVATSPYLDQLQAAAGEIARRVHDTIDRAVDATDWDLVFQSRSGPPHVPWLEPDVNDHLEALAATDVEAVLVVPLGFVSDHMEVVYDLDTEAAATADRLGLTLVRAGTAGTHPAFVAALRCVIQDALTETTPLAAVGEPWPNPCPEGCCAVPQRPAPPA